MTRIETDRLVLREFELGDAEYVLAFASNPDVARVTGDAGLVTSIDDVRRVIVDTWHIDFRGHVSE